jgi:hypothetical protein
MRRTWTDPQIICTALAVHAAATMFATPSHRGTLPLFVWSTLGFLAARRRERIPRAVVVETRAR